MNARHPNLIVLGAPKCGTTSMKAYLGEHPDIYIAKRKEMNYYAFDLPSREPVSTPEFLSEFGEWKNERYGTDVSVLYLYSRTAAAQIAKDSPDAKLIALLRNPVDTIAAYHATLVWTGNENVTNLEEALELESERREGRCIPPGLHVNRALLQYRDVVKYSEQLERYYAVFSREQIHIALVDDFRFDAQSAMEAVFDFLHLPSVTIGETNPRNQRKAVRSMFMHRLFYQYLVPIKRFARPLLSRNQRRAIIQKFRALNTIPAAATSLPSELRRRLELEYRGEIEDLGDLIQRDLSFWLQNK